VPLIYKEPLEISKKERCQHIIDKWPETFSRWSNGKKVSKPTPGGTHVRYGYQELHPAVLKLKALTS
jgi:hypothetical protein